MTTIYADPDVSSPECLAHERRMQRALRCRCPDHGRAGRQEARCSTARTAGRAGASLPSRMHGLYVNS